MTNETAMHFPNSWCLIIELHCAPYIRFRSKQIHLIRVQILYFLLFLFFASLMLNL